MYATFSLVVKVSSVGDVFFITSVDLVASKIILFDSGAFLWVFDVKQFSSKHTPSKKLAFPIEYCKEAVLLSPKLILMFMAHSNEVDDVEMWVR